jgi:hypothetical protein
MRSHSSIFYRAIIIAGLVAAGVVHAVPPRKPAASQFNILVAKSPFTIRATSEGTRLLSPLEKEWMLGSIRPNTGGTGWSVTLINKKDRKKRLRFVPGFSPDGYELLEVRQDTKSPKASEVKVSDGSQTAWIAYDDNLIKVRKTAQKGKLSSKQPIRTSVTKPSTTVQRTFKPASTGGVVRPIRPRYTPKSPSR